MRLKGTSSIVTGGGKGIGRAITLALAREGAEVAVIAKSDLRSAEATAREACELGSRAIALQADVTQKNSVDNMVGEVCKCFGKIDLLVNNAGMNIRGPLEQVAEEDWDKVVAVNLKGPFLCSVAVAREMIHRKTGGNIIHIAGASAHRCYAENGAFGPSKAAVINLTKQMAVEWAKYKIRVNEVSPGPTMTSPTEERIQNEEIRRRIAKIPLGRIATPDEVASVVVFLATEDSRYMTGQSLIVDGGSVHTWYLYP
jgi:NAD(P)-dependent dehydrogenase (short-subunit alcohol dehydrogenase family)